MKKPILLYSAEDNIYLSPMAVKKAQIVIYKDHCYFGHILINDKYRFFNDDESCPDILTERLVERLEQIFELIGD